MAFVTTADGIRYGLGLLGYIAVIIIIGYASALIALVSLDGGNSVIAATVVLAGILVSVAGLAGLTFKIISDGVQNGMSNAMENR